MPIIYHLLTTLIIPFALLRLFIKSKGNQNYRKRINERLALKLIPVPNDIIWLHCVSFGELKACIELIKALKQDNNILVTTTTPTGSDLFNKTFSNEKNIYHCYIPFDQILCCKRFISHYNPSIACFVETEIWPNLLSELNKKEIPALLINARLSEKSFSSYKKLGQFATKTITQFDTIACQDKASSLRFNQLGKESILLGNLKFDIKAPSNIKAQQDYINTIIKKPFIVAASTHSGEDEIIIKAFLAFQKRHANFQLIIAPRHPERATSISNLCKSYQQNSFLYSQKLKHLTKDSILIIDTLGDLNSFYSLATLAIIGGSFINHGGHNPLEAALFKKACIIGPSYFNFNTLIEAMQQEKAIYVCKSNDSETLTRALDLCIAQHIEMGESANLYLTQNQGAINRYKELILKRKNKR